MLSGMMHVAQSVRSGYLLSERYRTPNRKAVIRVIRSIRGIRDIYPENSNHE